MVHSGLMNMNEDIYLIMPKFFKTLWDFHVVEKNKLSKFSILAVGVSLLRQLKKLHSNGYTYNDLKLDNIMIVNEPDIEENKYNVFRDVELQLIDLGFV